MFVQPRLYFPRVYLISFDIKGALDFIDFKGALNFTKIKCAIDVTVCALDFFGLERALYS